MAIAVYVKIIQGKLSQQLSARSLLAPSATWGGALNWDRRAFSMQVAAAPKHVATVLRSMDEHEQKLCNLMKQKGLVSTKLECIKRDKQNICNGLARSPNFPDLEINRTIEAGMELKSLCEEEGKLMNMLEITTKDIENLCTSLNEERLSKISSLLAEQQAAQARHDSAVSEFEWIRQSTQYLDLIAYLFNNCEVTKENCYTHKILERRGKELREKFVFLSEDLLELGITEFVKRVRKVYHAELTCKLVSCLLSSNVDLNQLDVYSAGLNWETFVAVTKFSEQMKEFQSEFRELPTSDLYDLLRLYKYYKEHVAFGTEDTWQLTFEEKCQKTLEFQKERLQVNFVNIDRTHGSVFPTWRKGYRIDFSGDSEEEVQKLKKRFEELKIAEEVQKLEKRLEELQVAN